MPGAGDTDRAIADHSEAIRLRERALGPDHPDVAQSLHNLALLYGSQRQYADAERLYQRSLAIREKALGGDHLDVAWSLNNLARLYYDQGRYANSLRVLTSVLLHLSEGLPYFPILGFPKELSPVSIDQTALTTP
jgi:tetratricopeptide (TPR) repeat protein